jgi:hypothetical protein
MNNDFDKVLIIPIALLSIIVLIAIFSFWENKGVHRGEMNIKEAAVKANVAEWVADEDGKPEFRFKQ